MRGAVIYMHLVKYEHKAPLQQLLEAEGVVRTQPPPTYTHDF